MVLMMMVVNGDDGDINCGSDDGVHVGGNDCDLIFSSSVPQVLQFK